MNITRSRLQTSELRIFILIKDFFFILQIWPKTNSYNFILFDISDFWHGLSWYFKSNERNAYTRSRLDFKCPIIFLYTF